MSLKYNKNYESHNKLLKHKQIYNTKKNNTNLISTILALIILRKVFKR